MIVVSNSSPLIALSCLDQLSILKHLFGSIYIPESVYHEVVVKNTMSLQKQRIVQALDTIVFVKQSNLTHRFTRVLDAGEIGVLNLAKEIQANLVLLDDRKARNEAKEMGLRLAMTSAVLQWAAEQGLIASYHDAIHTLTTYRMYIPE